MSVLNMDASEMQNCIHGILQLKTIISRSRRAIPADVMPSNLLFYLICCPVTLMNLADLIGFFLMWILGFSKYTRSCG